MKQAAKYTFKVYLIAHGVPAIIFNKKRQDLIQNPIETLKKLILKILGSMGFLGGFIMVLRFAFCMLRFRGKIDFLYIFIVSIFCTSGVLLEDPSRGEDYAIFSFPKMLEGFWDLFKKIGIARDIPYSMNVIFAVSMGILLLLKTHHNTDMPFSYKNQLSFLFGKQHNETEEEKKK